MKRLALLLFAALASAPFAVAGTARMSQELVCGTRGFESTRGIALHDGTARVVCGTLEGHLKMFDLATGSIVWEVDLGDQRTDLVYNFAFTKDGSALAVIGTRGVKALFDAATGTKIRDLQPSTDGKCKSWLRGADFTPDETGIVSVGDGYPCLWDVATGGVKLVMGRVDSNNFGAGFSADGLRAYFFGSYELKIMDATTGEVQAIRDPFSLDLEGSPFADVHIDSGRVSPDGKFVAFGLWQASRTDREARLYGWQVLEIESRRLVASVLTTGPVYDVRFSDDGKELVLFEAGAVRSWSRIDLLTKQVLATAKADSPIYGEGFVWIALTPIPHPVTDDFTTAVTMSGYGKLRIWKVE